MTRHQTAAVTPREVLRWWPLVLVVALLAVGAAFFSVGKQQPEYTAVTRLVVVPLVQWDETFLGTSLIRDGGDAHSTAATTAALLDTRAVAQATAEKLGGSWTSDSVDKAVTVAVAPDTNVIEISGQASTPQVAEQVSKAFAETALDRRWQQIAKELDARIAAVTATTAADPNAGEASTRLQTLNLIRAGGADPTLRIESSTPGVEDRRLPFAAVLGVAGAGGAFVGLVVAYLIARVRRRPATPAEHAQPESDAVSVPSYSPNGGG